MPTFLLLLSIHTFQQDQPETMLQQDQPEDMLLFCGKSRFTSPQMIGERWRSLQGHNAEWQQLLPADRHKYSQTQPIWFFSLLVMASSPHDVRAEVCCILCLCEPRRQRRCRHSSCSWLSQHARHPSLLAGHNVLTPTTSAQEITGLSLPLPPLSHPPSIHDRQQTQWSSHLLSCIIQANSSSSSFKAPSSRFLLAVSSSRSHSPFPTLCDRTAGLSYTAWWSGVLLHVTTPPSLSVTISGPLPLSCTVLPCLSLLNTDLSFNYPAFLYCLFLSSFLTHMHQYSVCPSLSLSFSLSLLLHLTPLLFPTALIRIALAW